MDRGTKAELEVKLAIADYFIEQFADTPEGRKAFEALVGRFVGEYPHHKMLTHFLSHRQDGK
jgi:hypothetical protein